jgi:TatD DNase family protein
MWIDTHCHLDAPEFDADRDAVAGRRARRRRAASWCCRRSRRRTSSRVRALAHAHGLAYALGIHPLYVDRADDADLDRCATRWPRTRDDPRLVAVGEIGLDHFVPGLDRDRQQRFYVAQLKLARDAGLPVILHVRRSADALLAGLRACRWPAASRTPSTAARVQAGQFVERGFGSASAAP